MKKNKLNRLLKFGIFLLGITFSITSCEKDDENHSQDIKHKKTLSTITILKAKELKKNNNLMRIIDKAEKKAKNNSTNKTVYNADYDFTINTDYAKVINNNIGLKNYTFGVYRTQTNGLLENLLLEEQADSTFVVSLVQYNLTDAEKSDLINRQVVDVDDKITLVELEDISDSIFNKVNSDAETCTVWSYEWQEGSSCASGDHEVSDGGYSSINQGGCHYWGDPDQMATSGGYVLTVSEEACDGGGSTPGGPNDTSGNPDGGNQSGGYGGGNNTPPAPVTTPIFCPTCPTIEEDICNFSASPALAVLNLTDEDVCWMNRPSQLELKTELENYLGNGGEQEIAQLAIDTFKLGECAILPTGTSTDNYPDEFDDGNNQQIDHAATKTEYEAKLAANDKIGAIQYLIDTYTMSSFGTTDVSNNYTFSYNLDTDPEAHTTSTFDQITFAHITSHITIENGLFNFYDFGYITRAIKHEIYHVFQAKTYPYNATTNAEREFEAYFHSIYSFSKLKKATDKSETIWAYKVVDFYSQIDPSKLHHYTTKWNRFKLDYKEICPQD